MISKRLISVDMTGIGDPADGGLSGECNTVAKLIEYMRNLIFILLPIKEPIC